MFFSILARGSMTSRPQPVQRMRKSIPTPQHLKARSAAGVFFPCLNDVAHSDVHKAGLLSFLCVRAKTHRIP